MSGIRWENFLWKDSDVEEQTRKLNLPPCISARELINRGFPEPTWVVPGLLLAGLAILAGRPKIGKSWLALNIAVAVACSGLALGQIKKVEKSNTIYLALGDGPRRLKNRLASVLQGAAAPETLRFFTEFPRLDEGGAGDFRESYFDLQRKAGDSRHPGKGAAPRQEK